MSRRGRSRRQVQREPSGKISRAVATDPRTTVLAQPHRRWLPEGARNDQRAENALGRLYLAGFITEGQVSAGERWRWLMADYARLIDAPRSSPGALARMIEEKAGAEIEPPPADDVRGTVTETDEEFRDRVLTAIHAARVEVAGRDPTGAVARALQTVVVDDIDVSDITHLIIGLHALATFWRTFDDGRRPIRAVRDVAGDAIKEASASGR